MRIRVQGPSFVRELRFSKAVEPPGKIVFAVLQTQLRVEHMIVQAVDTYLPQHLRELSEVLGHVGCRKHESSRGHKIEFLAVRAVYVPFCGCQVPLENRHKFLPQSSNALELHNIDAP